MNRNYVNALDRLTEACETIGAHDKKPGAAWLVQASQAHALLAIHDLLAERLPMPSTAVSIPSSGINWAKWILSSSEDDTEGGPLLGERDPNDVDIAICEGCGCHLPCRHCPDTPTGPTDKPDVKSDPGPEPTPRALICTEAEAEAHREVRRLVITTYQIEDDPSVLRGIDGADMTTSALAWLERFVMDADPDVHPAYTGKPEKPMPGGRATGDDLSAPQPSEAPADGEGTW